MKHSALNTILMSPSFSILTKSLENFPHLIQSNPLKVVEFGSKLIRFEVSKESFIWVQPDEIRFVKSADHYVNALIQNGSDMKWMIRHSTVKDLLLLLPVTHFIRLNRFYVINRKHFSHIDSRKKLLFLLDGNSIPITHHISPFLLNPLRIDNT